MKNIKYILIVIIAAIVIIGGYLLIKPAGANQANHNGHDHHATNNHTDNDNHADNDHSDHDNHEGHGEKMVYLNSKQIEYSNIDTGWFSRKNINDIIHVSGYTKIPPQNQADVSVFSTGLIRSIKVIEGQFVKKGQLLATVESPDFTIMQENYLASKSKLEFLKIEFQRQKKLQDEHINSTKVFQKIKSDLEVEQARYNSLKRQLRILKVNGDNQTISTIPILSPISGNITDVYVKIGSSVESSKPLFSIVDNSEMHIDLMVYEKDLYKIKVGQNVRFVLTNQAHSEITGTIFNIGKSFENETKSVAVHADIDNNIAHLISGMYINAIIDIGTNYVNTLPNEAIVKAEGREFIFIMEKENFIVQKHDHHEGDHKHGNESNNKPISFSRVEVKTGATQLGYTQVTLLNNIHDGDKLVISGAYYLQSHLQKSESGGEHSH